MENIFIKRNAGFTEIAQEIDINSVFKIAVHFLELKQRRKVGKEMALW